MLLSIAYMLMVGMAAGWVLRKLRLPSLAGMILTGILLGPYALDLIDGSILGISAELRKIALTDAGRAVAGCGRPETGRAAGCPYVFCAGLF